ncbi:unnamed protein product [Blumeria hordei]|uniref:Uncharacterized protein n=1 Tax=Blumeria hordei TaxID=2867405 RepID=A0A383UYC3_BLUHO|nr:unnamed protein product [Blumeria hordei]
MTASRDKIHKAERQSPLRELSQPKNSTTETLNIIQSADSFTHSNNSSEDYSNPSASLYEAVYLSATSCDKNNHKIEVVSIPPRKRSPAKKNGANNENDENAAIDSHSYPQDTQFLYGFGTQLDTIKEQKSETTMDSSTQSRSEGNRKFISSRKYQDRSTLSNSLYRRMSCSSDRLCNKNSLTETCTTHGHEYPKLATASGFRAQPRTHQKTFYENPSTIHNLNNLKKLCDLRIDDGEPGKPSLDSFTDLSAPEFANIPSLMPLYSSLQGQSTPSTAKSPNFIKLEPLKRPLIPPSHHIYYKALAPKMKSNIRAQDCEIRLTPSNSLMPKNATKNQMRIKMSRYSFCNSSIVIGSDNALHCNEIQPIHNSSTNSISPTESNYPKTALRRVPRGISVNNDTQSPNLRRGLTTFQKTKLNRVLTHIRCHRHKFKNKAIKYSSMSVLLPAPSPVNFRLDPIDPLVAQARSSSTSPLVSGAMPLDFYDEGSDCAVEKVKLKQSSWKQKIGKSICRVDHIWMQATGCLCFSCSNLGSKNI